MRHESYDEFGRSESYIEVTAKYKPQDADIINFKNPRHDRSNQVER